MSYIPPAPQPAAEERIRRELKRLDQRLDIVWQPAWVFNGYANELEGRYVLVSWWHENDPRHREPDCYTNGKAYDIIGAFCRDVYDPTSTPEDPEEVLTVVLDLLAQCDGERVPHIERVRKVQQHNELQRERIQAEVEAEAEEAGLRAAREVFGKELFSNA